VPAEQGLLDEITFNTKHYKLEDGKIGWVWGKWAQAETLLHEQVHLWQQNFGENPVKPGRVHHNKEFVEKCESLGLHPLPGVGAHIKVADGVFAHLMNELGIPRPDDVPRESGQTTKKDWFKPDKERGRSTLHKWECPDCGLKVRIGIKDNPKLVHDSCSEKRGEKVFLVNHDGLQHVIFDGDADDKETPPIIDEINNRLRKGLSEDAEALTVEGIAEQVGISKNVLYEWMRTDSELSETLGRLNNVQEEDPFKTGTDEDSQVNAMMIAIVLMETRDRHYNTHN
jgi:hypothetical protein